MDTKSGPRCPNHVVPLEDLQIDANNKGKGIGICPISGWQFAFTREYMDSEPKIKFDKFGNEKPVYELKQITGGEGG